MAQSDATVRQTPHFFSDSPGIKIPSVLKVLRSFLVNSHVNLKVYGRRKRENDKMFVSIGLNKVLMDVALMSHLLTYYFLLFYNLQLTITANRGTNKKALSIISCS